ncbi:MAG TPA: glycosyltransferase family 4 protein [Acidimicrobiia bacterium]|nr:glycosyltransferase family 4 protein [Acidimicrobiia bacterium]
MDSSLRYLLLPQLEASLAHGHETLGISAPGPDVPFLSARGIRHIPLPASTRRFSLLADLRSVWQLVRILRNERLDVLHTHNPKPGLYGRIVGRLLGVPIVINTVHGLYATETDRLAKRLVVYLLEAVASRFSDLELIQSAEDVATIKRLRLASRDKVRYLGNGVDLDRFVGEPDETMRQAKRRELGLDSSAVVVGCVARLVAEKGIHELVEAYKMRTQDYELVVVGPPDPSKEDAIDRSKLEAAERSGVRFLGHRDDVDELYLAFDIFVLPSYREGFPRAAMEAAASGLPLVVTDVRGCREVVEDGVNGTLVPARDPGALATAVDSLVKNPDLRNEMGRSGARRARQHFDERDVVERVLLAYLEVAGRKGLNLDA